MGRTERTATDGAGPATGHEPTRRELVQLRRDVLRGSAGLWRDLPWRKTRDPWLVLVSEVMLQQTQAPRVVEPFHRFVARFPSPAACAAAGPAEVVRAWAGLGYNRRALNLHRAAVALVECHGGSVPGRLDALLALPGVGPYTARAVLAFAFGHPVGVVDTNVARVLSRAVAGRPLGARAAQRLADHLVPPKDSWRFNQALFDLGAGCCTARFPRCTRCPLAARCRWLRTGSTGTGADAADIAGGKETHVPDPAARGRRQTAFAGSDREGRGRLVGALRLAPVPSAGLARAAGWPDDEPRASRVAADLVDEGFACWKEGALVLA